jgi:hypothetical protein
MPHTAISLRYVGHPLTVGDIGPDQGTTESNRYRTQSVPSTAGLAARVADNWHLLVLGGWTLIWFVILAPHGGISWTFFTKGSQLLFGTGQGALPHTSGLDLYASQPQLQIGPLSFGVAQVLRHIGPDQGLVATQVVLTAVGLILVHAITAIATDLRPDLTARPGRLRGTVLVGGAVFLIAWVELSVAYTHLDDGLALAFAVLAVRGVAGGRPALAGLCIGLATDAKPWALVILPILLVLPGRARWTAGAYALAAICAAWLPFVIADPGTLAATHFTIRNMPSSALRALGVTDPRTPSWDRPAQLAVGWVAGVIAVLRRRWPAVILLGVGARVALDPGVHGYYTAGVMVGALLWDLLGARGPYPAWSLASFAALNLAPLLTKDAALLGNLRLGLVVAFTAALLLGPDRWYPPTGRRPAQPDAGVGGSQRGAGGGWRDPAPGFLARGSLPPGPDGCSPPGSTRVSWLRLSKSWSSAGRTPRFPAAREVRITTGG